MGFCILCYVVSERVSQTPHPRRSTCLQEPVLIGIARAGVFVPRFLAVHLWGMCATLTWTILRSFVMAVCAPDS